MELKEGKDLLVKCKMTKFSVSIVQPQQRVDVSDMENKVPDVLLHKDSVGKFPMNRLTDSVQSNGDANGCIRGHAHGTFFTGNESASYYFQKSAVQVDGKNHCTTLKNKDLPIINYKSSY